ncbi:MAG: hypothetical protein WCD35_08935 [Mycobacteriales bacterium]
MSHVVAIGERSKVQGFVPTGADVVVAEDPVAVQLAWYTLAADVDVVLLTAAARGALGPGEDEDLLDGLPGKPLLVVLPP